jgi:hypothetical protein
MHNSPQTFSPSLQCLCAGVGPALAAPERARTAKAAATMLRIKDALSELMMGEQWITSIALKFGTPDNPIRATPGSQIISWTRKALAPAA